jgi:hypothetical protein
MTWPKTKDAKRLRAKERINVDLFGGVHILT